MRNQDPLPGVELALLMNRTKIVSMTAFAMLVVLYAVARSLPVTVVVPPRPPIPQENGFLRLTTAASRIVKVDGISNARLKKPKREWSFAEKHALVNENRDIIWFAHQTLRLPYQETNTTTSIEDDAHHYSNLRHLTWLLTLAGDVAWESGNQSAAADYYLDAVVLGRKLPNRIGVEGHLLGLSCELIARSHLWRRLENMDASTAQKCLTHLNDLESVRVPLCVAFEEEKYTAQSIVVEITDEVKATSYLGIVPRSIVMNSLSNYMDKQIALTKMPYSFGNEEIPCPKVPLVDLVAPATQFARFKYATVQTGDTLLRTALAVRVYRERTGKSPANLADLVAAKLLDHIPDDPFASPGTPLRYKLQPNGKPLIYSVGPDGIDNGGQGIVGKTTKGTATRVVSIESHGDMVTGWSEY